jgi:CHASE2 domain-containing sensor protein
MRRQTVRRQERFPGFYLPLILVMVVPSVTGFSLAWTFRNPLGLTIPLAIASLGLLIVYSIQYGLAVNRSFPNWRARVGQSKDGAV